MRWPHELRCGHRSLTRADGDHKPEKALGTWLCSKQPTATKTRKRVGSSPGCAPNSRRRFQTRRCWELPGCAPNSWRCSPTESDSRKEKQTNQSETRRSEKGRRTSLHATHCTAHLHTLHTQMHAHARTHNSFYHFWYSIVRTCITRSTRYLAPHTNYDTHHTPHFFLGGGHPRLSPQPANSPDPATTNQQRKAQPA